VPLALDGKPAGDSAGSFAWFSAMAALYNVEK